MSLGLHCVSTNNLTLKSQLEIDLLWFICIIKGNTIPELVINECIGFPTEWKSTEDEIKTLPLKAKLSVR